MANRAPYDYFYFEYFLGRLACCTKCESMVKRRKRFDLHQNSVDRLAFETDIVSVLNSVRASNFLQRIQLKKYQHYFINKC